jgi:dipeptidyl aminopeptidase/acylaminoacyl peptidase
MISRRQAIAGAMVVPFLIPVVEAAAAGQPHGLEDFVRAPRDRDAALSPDGKIIAVGSTVEKGDDRDSQVTLIPADAPDTVLKILPLGDREIDYIAWASPTRLLIAIQVPAKPGRAKTGTRVQAYDEDKAIPVRRVLAIDIDGANSVILFNDGTEKVRQIYDLGTIVDLLPDDPDHILMRAFNADAGVMGLYRVNVGDGKVEMIETGTLKTWSWVVQGGKAVARYDYNMRGTELSIHLRAPGAKDWTFFRRFGGENRRRPQFFASDVPGTLLFKVLDGPDKVAVVRTFDLATSKAGDILASRPGRDIDSVLITRRGTFLGASYTDDRVGYVFVDPKMGGHLKGLNKFLGDTCNIRIIDISDSGDRFLAWVSGPNDPGSLFFYDRVARRFEAVGSRRPNLDPERLAGMETLRVKTRDGAEITAYLSAPLASGPRPLVVMPHGGPETRDMYDFDLFAQVMAAQGWMVLQPNFRGSGGYGEAFADAGRKRWGDRMQEDVEDAVDLVLASGRVDPARVAIFGYSYGGYAALQGAVRRPQLYKAVVGVAGVYDLMESLAETKRDDGPDSTSYAYWRETIGDPATDRAAMEAASPSLHADRIAAPVLLMHGTEDTTVPPQQSKIMAKALRDAGKTVEHVEIRGANHNGLKERHWRLIYTRSVEHIAKAFKA